MNKIERDGRRCRELRQIERDIIRTMDVFRRDITWKMDAVGRLINELGQLESDLFNLRGPGIGMAVGSFAGGLIGAASDIISSTISAEKGNLERQRANLESRVLSYQNEINALEASWIDFQIKLGENANEMALLSCIT
ncbi:MAG: hypothetical protein JKX91_13330 [Rhizobiaceae bacterium]|nr:hypothetical protein [Rhizobiaceae bacterium]